LNGAWGALTYGRVRGWRAKTRVSLDHVE